MDTASSSAVLNTDPDTVFRTLTDLGRLPEWNTAITRLIEQPAALDVGAEWLVEMHALGQKWPSRARVEVIEPKERRFAYRARSDDGNPSYAHWAWAVEDDPAGSRVTVTWDLHPATFWRRVLLARIRARQLARTEVPASLRALGEAAANPPSAAGDTSVADSTNP